MFLFGPWIKNFRPKTRSTNPTIKLKVAERRMERKRKKLVKNEKKILKDVKKAMEQGDMEGAKLFAQEVVRTRHMAHGIQKMVSRLKSVRHQVEQAKFIQVLGNEMEVLVKILGVLNRKMDLSELDVVMDNLVLQMDEIAIKNEEIGETMDMATATTESLESEEEEVNEILKHALTEDAVTKLGGLEKLDEKIKAVKIAEKKELDEKAKALAQELTQLKQG
ncbi:MAG: Snf7 family protein [Candidatus Hodarchaeales archaeon]|jgi:charged multivesicular body protein 1